MAGLLGKLRFTIQDSTGIVVPLVNVTVRRRGATVEGDVSGVSPLTVTVDNLGALKNGDSVAINTGVTTFTVGSINRANRTLQLSGFAGGLSLSNLDRLTPTNDLPVLYLDVRGDDPATNPLQSNSSGIVTAWADVGWYDFIVSGGGVNTQLLTDIRSEASHNFDIREFGVKMDGVTDDGPAIQRALDEAEVLAGAVSFGGVVELIRGEYAIGAPLIIPNRVRLIGAGKRATRITALGSFTFNGTTDAMVRLGRGTATNTFGTQVRSLTLDCNNNASSIGVFSNEAHEHSGVFDASIVNFKSRGIYFDNGGATPQNWVLEHLEVLHTDAAAIGIDIESAAGGCVIYDVTVNSNNATLSANPGIRIADGSVNCIKIHGEQHANVINCVVGSAGVIMSASGHSSVTGAVVKIDQPGTLCLNIIRNGAAFMINDTTAGGPGSFSENGGGFYFSTNDGGGGTKTILSSTGQAASRMNSPFTFQNTAAFVNTITVQSTASIDINSRIRKNAWEDVVAAATISVVKNKVRLTGGPVTLSTINIDGGAPSATHDGYELTLYASSGLAGNVTLSEAGNIILVGSPVLSADQLITFIWNNTRNKWIQMTDKAAH